MELAMHLTGIYPVWWKGRKYKKAITAWVGGISNESTRDICQAELLGPPEDPTAWGTGCIPRDTIVSAERKPGVPNAKSIALVRHLCGDNSTVHFKSYESGTEKWMGRSVDCIWLDEEPDRSLYSQSVTRTLDRRGMVYLTFTPEKGMTETVSAFMNNIKKGQSLTNATWDDASEDTRSMFGRPGHLDHETMDQILAAYSPHEREMRKYGKPVIGSGLVFPIPEEKLIVEPFEIPEHWLRIAAIDLGWDHDTAVVWGAHDVDEDIFYIYDSYNQNKRSPADHSVEIKRRPAFIPIAYPHDGLRRDSMGNPGLANQYRDLGCNFMLDHFTNPPALGQSKGSNNVEQGIQAMIVFMEEGRFRIFNTLHHLLQEYRQYHRKDGKIVAIRDDCMSAMRYCFMSRRFGVAGADETWQFNFDKPIQYNQMGIV
jgi:phage terminase large subunit-like protein